MASAKDTFEANTFEANSFACGTWRGSLTVVNYGRGVVYTYNGTHPTYAKQGQPPIYTSQATHPLFGSDQL